MSGYLEEIRRSDEDVCTWQTPNRQRYWGLGGCVVAGIIMSHALSLTNLRFERLSLEFWIGSGAMIVAILATTWTIRFVLDFKRRTYALQRGFLPILIGERGNSSDAFQAIVVRKEAAMDTLKHDRDSDFDSFEQYRVLIVWKASRRDAMLLDTFPSTYLESKSKEDFHQLALKRANELSLGTGVEILDQSVQYSRAAISDDSSVGDATVR